MLYLVQIGKRKVCYFRRSRKPEKREKSATATTAASGGNREELLGQRPAGCKARSRAAADAGSRNPSKRQYKNNISFQYAQSEAEGILNGQITWNKKNFR